MQAILVLNAGSSSLKFQIFAIDGDRLDRRVKGQIDGIGVRPRLKASGASRVTLLVVRTDEELMIARHTLALVGAPAEA